MSISLEYQGRHGKSTNGCAVIAPLVVSRHMKSTNSISNINILDVIENESPPLLKEIWKKLGIKGNGFIIPSNVIDDFVDRNILSQSMFQGTSGGSILDNEHTEAFLQLLEGGSTGDAKMKKTAAAFYFHEHVVSIIKV
jgi:hypothetical protein